MGNLCTYFQNEFFGNTVQKGGVGDVMIIHLLFVTKCAWKRKQNDMKKMDFLHYRLSLPGKNPTNCHKHRNQFFTTIANTLTGSTPTGQSCKEVGAGKELVAGELWYMQPAMITTPLKNNKNKGVEQWELLTTVLKPTQVNWLRKLRRRENHAEGTRQNGSVTSV